MKDKEKKINQDISTYPGLAKDEADKDKVNKRLVDQNVDMLNNNPRNGDQRDN